MNPKIAARLNQYLNKPEITETLKDYAEEQILLLIGQLKYAQDFNQVKHLQGRILELDNLTRLRDVAIAVLENERASDGKKSYSSTPQRD